jgi:hypothetical protein
MVQKFCESHLNAGSSSCTKHSKLGPTGHLALVRCTEDYDFIAAVILQRYKVCVSRWELVAAPSFSTPAVLNIEPLWVR